MGEVFLTPPFLFLRASVVSVVGTLGRFAVRIINVLAKKALEVHRLCQKCDIVVLQETHGSEESLRVLLSASCKTHNFVFHSGHLGVDGHKGDTGGLQFWLQRRSRLMTVEGRTFVLGV